VRLTSPWCRATPVALAPNLNPCRLLGVARLSLVIPPIVPLLDRRALRKRPDRAALAGLTGGFLLGELLLDRSLDVGKDLVHSFTSLMALVDQASLEILVAFLPRQ
jgi:hypothetical protein